MNASPTKIRRTLTDTPLARAHERALLDHGSKRHKPIPYDRFDRRSYPDAALALSFDAQKALALGEYTAVDLFARIASGLALNGAPFDVVAAATRIPTDEIRHADITFRMARLISGEDVEVKLDREALAKRWSGPMTLEALDCDLVEISAIGETLSCALLGACHDRATDPALKAIFASIVADEVHHARLGWYYLAWRAPQWTRAERQRVADRAGVVVMNTERQFWKGRDAPAGARAAARALGVLESAGQRRAVHAVMQNEIVPALDALGLGASHAWRARRRGARPQ
ncbi:MAG: ferritin-like domain-containing protein [Polyangiaceae bacterium]